MHINNVLVKAGGTTKMSSAEIFALFKATVYLGGLGMGKFGNPCLIVGYSHTGSGCHSRLSPPEGVAG